MLASAQERHFLERAFTFINSQLERGIGKGELETLVRRGRGYGLEAEQDLMGYLFVAAISGTGRRRDDPEWIKVAMTDPKLLPGDRVKALHGVAEGVWAQAIAAT